MPNHDLRQQYEAAVAELANIAAEKLRAGACEEDVAHWAVSARNTLKHHYRDLTPAPILKRIIVRTRERYGNETGPTAQDLHSSGKTWKSIIESATRAGRHDEALFGAAASTEDSKKA